MTPYTAFGARWVVPVAGPPVADGYVVVEGGVVAEVTRARPAHVTEEFGAAVLMPALVNAHTHLDLTGLAELAPPRADYVGWLRDVIGYRRTRTLEQVAEDVRAGIRQSLAAGVGLVGDIASFDTSPLLAESSLKATVFRELLGLTPERADAAWELARAWEPTGVAAGLSPHAPYSVHRSLFERALASGRPTAVHLAEWADEGAMLGSDGTFGGVPPRTPKASPGADATVAAAAPRHSALFFGAAAATVASAPGDALGVRGGTPPLADFLKSLGVWHPAGLIPSWSWLLSLPPTAPRLWVHANHLPPQPLPPADTVVICPRTHAAFGHPPFPLADWLARGVRVAVGTDSLASNPNLSILAELRFLQTRHPTVDAATVVRMGTLAGATALGWAARTGCFSPGRSADIIRVPLADPLADDPCADLLKSHHPAEVVCLSGQRIRHDSPIVVHRQTPPS